jgi:hypothetical protein
MLKITPIVKSMAPTPIQESVQFQWNVEGYASAAITFDYYIGEGPLYWFKIDWLPSVIGCPPSQICVSMTPSVTYEENPNCPTEVTETCTVNPPTCGCDTPCMPGQCISITKETWHMLATSVTHLCYRINNECCGSKPNGFIKRIRQFMRPALCCDVALATDIVDEYVDVDFIDNCECGNLVHPCLAQITYDCSINNCGINGPVATMIQPPETMMMAAVHAVDTLAADLTIIPPKQITINKIANRFGSPVPELLHCNINNVGNVDLYYDSQRKVWRGIKDTTSVEWSITESSGYKFELNMEKNKRKSKVLLNVKNETFNKDLKIDFNAKSKTLKSKGLLQSVIVEDFMDDLKILIRG